MDSSSLRQKIVKVTEQALRSGALRPISTQLQILPDRGIHFCVRVIDSLARKEAEKRNSKPKLSSQVHNPFLPYEEALFITHLSETHVCLLNKFNVVDHHILMVTRDYESQDTWLTYSDFEAFAQCLVEIDGLGFYNGGKKAGASQHHKHLQLVPFSRDEGDTVLPISELIHTQRDQLANSSCLHLLPFQHRISLLNISWTFNNCAAIAHDLRKIYQALMADMGLELSSPKPEIPYNFLLTRKWMMVVLRSQESYQDIGVNSLGYSGWLLVKTTEDLARLRQIGPMNLLQKVSKPD